jgi:hypothetical protein
MRKILLICLFIVSCGSSVQTVTGSNNSSKLSDYNIFLELKNSTGGTSVSGGAMGSSNVAIVGGSKYDGNSQTVQVFETIKFELLLKGIKIVSNSSDADAIGEFSIGQVRYDPLAGWIADQAFLIIREKDSGSIILAARAESNFITPTVKNLIRNIISQVK